MKSSNEIFIRVENGIVILEQTIPDEDVIFQHIELTMDQLPQFIDWLIEIQKTGGNTNAQT